MTHRLVALRITLILSLLVGHWLRRSRRRTSPDRTPQRLVSRPREVKAESFRQGLRELGYVEARTVSPRASVGGVAGSNSPNSRPTWSA